jgi:hypothetical protein
VKILARVGSISLRSVRVVVGANDDHFVRLRLVFQPEAADMTTIASVSARRTFRFVVADDVAARGTTPGHRSNRGDRGTVRLEALKLLVELVKAKL